MQLVCLHPPRQEPVSVGEAKQYLRIDHEAEDELLANLIQTARSAVEDFTQRSLMAQVWQLTITEQPSRRLPLLSKKTYPGKWVVDLPRAPFVKLVSAPQIVERKCILEYQLAPNYDRGRLLLEAGRVAGQTLRVDFIAGYGDDPESVPSVLRQAVLLLVADFYQHRGEGGRKVGMESVYQLLQPYVWMSLH